MRYLTGLLALSLALMLSACAQQVTSVPANHQAPPLQALILATTTSTQDSGLLDVLIPDFEQKSGFKVQTVAVGTGQALKIGEEGNADVLLVHAPASEKTFMEAGFGKDRVLVMHNDFILVGPSSDPTGIQGMNSAVEALGRIIEIGATFVSRGDDSGTHKMELSLWNKAGITPQGEWYIESGQGMGATLRIASEKAAYTLTDRATYLTNSGTLDLAILLQGDSVLLNVYHVITVNPEKWPKINYDGAIAFVTYLISQDVQSMIGEYGVDKYGQPLFFPDAGKSEGELGLP